MNNHKKIATIQAEYYGKLFEKNGPSLDAVASGKKAYKHLRYERLSKVFERDIEFSIHDVGFGVGSYLEYLSIKYSDRNIVYSGSEVTIEFVNYCEEEYPKNKFYNRDLAIRAYKDLYDYLIFGGTFYHIVDSQKEAFSKFIEAILSNAFKMSKKGIAFNFISEFVDYKYDGLYYQSINSITDYIVNNISRYFTIDHSSPLYEFTVCVYKEEYIKSCYPEKEFHKYYK